MQQRRTPKADRKGPLLQLLQADARTMQQILDALATPDDVAAWRSAVGNLVKSGHLANLCTTRGGVGRYTAARTPPPRNGGLSKRRPDAAPRAAAAAPLPQQCTAGLDLARAWHSPAPRL